MVNFEYVFPRLQFKQPPGNIIKLYVLYPVQQKCRVLTVSKTQGFLSVTCQCMMTERLDFWEAFHVTLLSRCWETKTTFYSKASDSFLSLLSFSIYCLALAFEHYRQVTLYHPECRMKAYSNHIEIIIGYFNLHKGWLSLHRGHPVNFRIRRMIHLSSVIPANDL